MKTGLVFLDAAVPEVVTGDSGITTMVIFGVIAVAALAVFILLLKKTKK